LPENETQHLGDQKMATVPNLGRNKADDKAKPGQTAAGAPTQVQNPTPTIGSQAKEATSTIAHAASDAASYVGHKVEDATAAVGSGMQSLGSTIREHAPQSGVVGNASTAVANTLENTGGFLKEEGLQGIADDLTNLIRRNPVPALLVGLGVGFLIARATTPRS
jgi:hypothetical protein